MTLYTIFGIVGIAVIVWLLTTKLALLWYEWVLGVLGWLIGLWALQNWSASILEAEPRAAGLFLAILGIPALILLAVACFLPYKRLKAK